MAKKMVGDLEQRLLRLATKMDEGALASLNPWLRAGLDPLGGAPGFLDRFFRPRRSSSERGPSGERLGDQSLVQQARHLYSYSLVGELRPQVPLVDDFAHALYHHLLTRFTRGPHGSSVPASGKVLDRPFLHWIPREGRLEGPAPDEDFALRDPTSPFVVQLYAQGFSIYALCAYARAFAVPQAAEQARSLFRRLDEARHEPARRGYDQRRDGGWLSFVGAPIGACLCMNTHIHLLEAFTHLLRCCPSDEKVHERVVELAALIGGPFQRDSGALSPYLGIEGTPVGPPVVSYGHDLESSWLLLDTLDLLETIGGVGKQFIDTLRRSAERMARHALRTGWDPVGGIFDRGLPEGVSGGPRVMEFDKVWWAQAEALLGIFRLFELTLDWELISKLEKTLDFLFQKNWDAAGTEFYWSVDSRGVPGKRGTHKGEIWKTPYHASRALLMTSDRIRNWQKGAPR